MEAPAGKKQQSELRSVQSFARLEAAEAGLFEIVAAGAVVAGLGESQCIAAVVVELGSLAAGLDPGIL